MKLKEKLAQVDKKKVAKSAALIGVGVGIGVGGVIAYNHFFGGDGNTAPAETAAPATEAGKYSTAMRAF